MAIEKTPMVLYIKNMVCDRCIMVVQDAFAKAGLSITHIILGRVEVREEVSKEKITEIELAMKNLGFEIMDDKRSRIIEKIKNSIIRLVHHGVETPTINLSEYLAAQMHYDYNYLSTLFSGVEGITIEKYFILQKVERIKELLVYDEHSISQIADLMGYSSVGYLSNQFKQATGFPPSQFKNLHGKRKPLDKV